MGLRPMIAVVTRETRMQGLRGPLGNGATG